MICLVIASIFLWTGGQSCQISGTFDPCYGGNNKSFPYMSDRCPDCDDLSNDRSDLYDLDHDTWYITAFNMTTRYVSPFGCGARIPIWMNGTIPMIAEGVVSRTACVATFESLCASSYSIKVKRCDSSYNVYCLDNLPNSIQQRYCFDLDPISLTPTTTSKTPSTTRSMETPSKAPSTIGATTTTYKVSSSIRSATTSNAPSMIVSTTTRSLSRSPITQTTKPSTRLSLSTEAKPVAYMPRDEENGIQIWVIGVISGLIAAIAILGAVLIYMKRRVSKEKEDNEYDVPEKKYVNDTQSNDYMTLDLPPKEAISAISDQNEARENRNGKGEMSLYWTLVTILQVADLNGAEQRTATARKTC